jgi:hypothetical protein
MLGHRQAELASVNVQNPYFSAAHEISLGNPTHTSAAVNVRESAITSLASRGLVEEHMVQAATRFRRHYEALQGYPGRSSGFHERVDGGRNPDGFGQRQVDAGTELRKARQLLGKRGYVLVSMVAGEGRDLGEFCHTKREKLTCADVLRALLSDLSALWGFSR